MFPVIVIRKKSSPSTKKTRNASACHPIIATWFISRVSNRTEFIFILGVSKKASLFHIAPGRVMLEHRNNGTKTMLGKVGLLSQPGVRSTQQRLLCTELSLWPHGCSLWLIQQAPSEPSPQAPTTAWLMGEGSPHERQNCMC